MITSDPLLATDQPRLMSRPYTKPIGSPSRPAKVQPWHSNGWPSSMSASRVLIK